MNAATNYRSYPEIVKDEVARTGNVYLFPDLKIPRTTAQYWVKKQKFSRRPNVLQIESVYKRKSEFLVEELAKEKAMRELLETARKVFPYDFRTKQLKNKLSRAQIVTAIRECVKYHKLAHCLDAIGLPKSAYLRWSSEISACKRTNSLCERRRPTQLTSDELTTMKKFVTSKKFAHISVSSLHLLAQRTGELFCSVDTWYKYVRSWEWKRPWTNEKKKIAKDWHKSKESQMRFGTSMSRWSIFVLGLNSISRPSSIISRDSFSHGESLRRSMPKIRWRL